MPRPRKKTFPLSDLKCFDTILPKNIATNGLINICSQTENK
jgi:hypothetical protein